MKELTSKQIIDSSTIGEQSVKHAKTANTLDGLTASIKELNYVTGLTGNIQEQLNNKSAVQFVIWEAND